MKDRSDYRVRKVAGKAEDGDVGHLSPAERFLMVEELTRQAWAFRDGADREPRLRRDVGRVVRGKR